MMQDRSSMKKANSSFIDVDKPVAEIDKEKLEELSHAEEKKEEAKDDPFGGLEQFAVAENANIGSESKDEPDNEKEEEKKEEISIPEEKQEDIPAVSEEPKVEEKPEEPETPVVPEEPEKDIAEIQRENIASVVSEFKSEKSRLASGGVVIERNEPIARRERPKAVEEFDNLEYEEPVAQVPVQEEYYPKTDEINKLNINENTDTILNSLKTSAGGYDAGYQGYNNGSYGQTSYGNQSYGYQAQNPTYVSPVDPYANSYMNQQQMPDGKSQYQINQHTFYLHYQRHNAYKNSKQTLVGYHLYIPSYNCSKHSHHTPSPYSKVRNRIHFYLVAVSSYHHL
jgi:hypothetical protein